MRIQLMTFRYAPTLGGFDDRALMEFLRGKELTGFREYFYLVQGVPHLTCILQIADGIVAQEVPGTAPFGGPLETPLGRASEGGGGSGSSRRKKRGSSADVCEGLDEPQRVQFNNLREWRTEVSRKQGVPPYIILTNKQLVAIVRRRPDSLTALGHLEGIGPAKLERFGTAILERIHGVHVSEAEPNSQAQPGSTPAEAPKKKPDKKPTAVPPDDGAETLWPADRGNRTRA